MLKVLQGGRVDLQDKVLYSFAAKLRQRQLDYVTPSGPYCPWPCPFIGPVAA